MNIGLFGIALLFAGVVLLGGLFALIWWLVGLMDRRK
jgi:hypothetical protein